ncbi:hypothetical protein ACIQU3_24740 [Streptomyces sp. NPDC101110]|uniref:hypothetical protein n=1 Tax=unclassified Streptomyces TaxID=2593676 RepID=UPI003800B374
MQPPAREALLLIEEEPRRPEPALPATRPAAPAAAPRQHAAQPPGQRQVRPRPARPERAEPAPRGPQRSHDVVPDWSESMRKDVVKRVPKSQADVCALGRRYGGWRADSPEATACREAYGR